MQAFRMDSVTYRLVLCLSLLSCRHCAAGGVLPSATPRSVSDAVPSARRESGQRSHDVIRRVSPPEGSGPLTALLRNGMTSAPLKGSASVARPAKHLPSFPRNDVPFSLAGRRHGQNDDRSAIKPSWVSKSSDKISRKLRSSLSASLFPRYAATASSAETSKEKLASSRSSLSALTNSPLDASDSLLIPTSASETRAFSKPATSSSVAFSTSKSAATERTTSTPKAVESSWMLSTTAPETRTASRAATVTSRALPGSFISYALRPLTKGETAVAEPNDGGSGPSYFFLPRRHRHLGNAANNKDDDTKEASQDRRRDEHRELRDAANVDDLNVLNGRFQHEEASREGADWQRMTRIRSDRSLSSTQTHGRAAGQHVGKLQPSSTEAYSRRAGQDREHREEENRQGMNLRSASRVRSDQIPSSTPTLSGAADPAHRRLREKERRGGLDWQRMSQVARDLAHRLTGQQLLGLLRQLEAVRRRKTMTASDTVDIADTCCLV